MTTYYQISLQNVVDLFTKKDGDNVLFTLNQYNITLQNVIPFIYDEIFLTKEDKSDYESVIYNIVLQIHNPENIHNGTIIIEKDTNQMLSIVNGIENIISALYHKKNLLTVSSSSKLNLPFELITIENLDNNNSHFGVQQHIFLNDHLNYDFLEIIKNSDNSLSETWYNKEYVIQQVINNHLDIKDYISKDMLEDKDFILELIHINYHLIDHFYDFLSIEFQSTLHYIFKNLEDTNREKFSEYLGSILPKYTNYFTNSSNMDNRKNRNEFTNEQEQVIESIMTEDLLLFIVGNSKIPKHSNAEFYDFIHIIPNYIWENENFVFEVFKNFSCKMLCKLHPSFFNKPENIAFLFNTLGGYWYSKQDWVYESIYDFFKNNEHAYKTWFNNKLVCLTILKNYNTADKINGYLHCEYPIAKLIYDSLNSNLQKDIDILYELLLLSPEIFILFDKDMQKNNRLALYYLQKIEKVSTDIHFDQHYIFALTDTVLVKKILHAFPQLLLEENCPLEWQNDIKNYNINAMRIFNKFSQAIQKFLCTHEDFIKEMLERDYTLYYHLPLYLKRNKEIILLSIDNKKFDVSTIPPSVLLNKTFCEEMLALNINILKNVPYHIKYSVDFILTVYKKVNLSLNNNNNNLYSIVNDYYPEIKILLTYCKINKADSYEFLSNYFINQKKYLLHEKLNIKHEHRSSNILYKEAIKKI